MAGDEASTSQVIRTRLVKVGLLLLLWCLQILLYFCLSFQDEGRVRGLWVPCTVRVALFYVQYVSHLSSRAR